MNVSSDIGMAAFMTLLCWASASFATPDLGGQWTVRWPGAGQHSENAMSLIQSGDSVTGNYINDSGDSCAVTGAVTGATNRIRLHIACARWSIDMDGTIASDGRSAAGDYQAYQSNQVGQFSMSKK